MLACCQQYRLPSAGVRLHGPRSHMIRAPTFMRWWIVHAQRFTA